MATGRKDAFGVTDDDGPWHPGDVQDGDGDDGCVTTAAAAIASLDPVAVTTVPLAGEILA